MKLKQLFIFSMLALCGVALTSCDDEKQDIIDDVNITDDTHIMNLLCDFLDVTNPIFFPDPVLDEPNNNLENYTESWVFKFYRSGEFKMVAGASLLHDDTEIYGNWRLVDRHITFSGHLKDDPKVIFTGEIDVTLPFCEPPYVTGTCVLFGHTYKFTPTFTEQ